MTNYKIEEATTASDGSVDRVELVRVILLRKIVVATFVLAFGVVACILVWLIKPSYTARATFLPPNSLSATSSLPLAQLGALGGAGGLLGGIKDPSMIYAGILGSRTVADELIQEFNLQTVYRNQEAQRDGKTLSGTYEIHSGEGFADHDQRGRHGPATACG